MKDRGTYSPEELEQDEEAESLFDNPAQHETFDAESVPPPPEPATPELPQPPPLEPVPSPDDVKRWISQRESMIEALRAQHRSLLEQAKETEALLESLGAPVQDAVSLMDSLTDWRELGVKVVDIEDVQGLPRDPEQEEKAKPKAARTAAARPRKPKWSETDLTSKYKNLLNADPKKPGHPGLVLTDNMKALLKVMSKKPQKINEISAKTDLTYQTIWNTLKPCLKRGLVVMSEVDGVKRYAKA